MELARATDTKQESGDRISCLATLDASELRGFH